MVDDKFLLNVGGTGKTLGTYKYKTKHTKRQCVCYGFVSIGYGPDWINHWFLGALVHTLHAYV